MYYLILSLLILDALILAAVVLLQAGQGGGLASLGGATTDSVLGSRQSVTLLTRMSWWCGGAFLVLSLLLSLMSAGSRTAATSDLQQRLRTSAPPAGTTPSPLPLTPAPTPPVSGTTTPGAGSGGAAPAPPVAAPKTAPAR